MVTNGPLLGLFTHTKGSSDVSCLVRPTVQDTNHIDGLHHLPDVPKTSFVESSLHGTVALSQKTSRDPENRSRNTGINVKAVESPCVSLEPFPNRACIP